MRRLLLVRHAATVAGIASVVVLVAGLALPGVHEVPAVTLWELRHVTVGTQLVLWTTLGTVFALGARRAMTARGAATQAAALAARDGD